MILARLSTILIATAAVADAVHLEAPQNSDGILHNEMLQLNSEIAAEDFYSADLIDAIKTVKNIYNGPDV